MDSTHDPEVLKSSGSPWNKLARRGLSRLFKAHKEFGQAGKKERGARQSHKRLLYCVNLNRTSLDHLLLGRNTDVDKNVEWSEYNAGWRRCQNKQFLNL